MTGLSTRYVKTGPLNAHRREDGYDTARRVWGDVSPELELLTVAARVAGLKRAAWMGGRLSVEHPTTGERVEIRTQDDLSLLQQLLVKP